MSENKKSKKEKNKNVYTRKIYKISQDEDFFESGGEGISNSVLFQKQINQPDSNNNKSAKEKNILSMNKKFIEKIINSKGSTSSSNKIKNEYKGNNGNTGNNNIDNKIDNNFILYEEIENSDNSENKKEKSIEKSVEKSSKFSEKKEKNSKKIIINMNESNHGSKRELLSSNIFSNEKNEKNNSIKNDGKDDEEEVMKKIMNNYVDSSFNSSLDKKSSKLKSGSNKNSSRNIKKDLSSNKIYSECSSKSNIKIKNPDNKEESKEKNTESNKNSQNLITLKPLNIQVRNKNSNKMKIKPSKKISFMKTNSEPTNAKKEENNKLNRKTNKKTTQKEYSINSSNSSNNKEHIEENNIKIFIEKYFLTFPILILMVTMNFFSLFLNDIRHIWLDKKVDIYFDIINFITIIYFILEIIEFYLLDNSYLNSFIFWIDAIGAFCIIFNIELISNYIFVYNNIKNKSKTQISNTMEYLHICIIMLERVLRVAKIYKCLKLYNLIETVKKINKRYSEKMERDIVKEKNQKQKLMNKIKNLEEEENEIDESVVSDESHQTKNSIINENNDSESNKINNDEEKNNDSQEMKKKIRRMVSITDVVEPKIKKNLDKIKKIKRPSTIKKINQTFYRKQSLKNIRQNNLFRNSIGGSAKLNLFHFDKEKEDKKEDEKIKRKKQIEEEMYKKIDENINNIKITNKVKYTIRKKIIIIFTILLLICVILNQELFSNIYDNGNILSYSYIFDIINNCPFEDDNICKDKINKFLLMSNENALSIINITKNNILIYENLNLTKNNYRYCDLRIISSDNHNDIINIIFSLKRSNIIKHALYLILTIILCISFLLASILYETDLTHILLTPLEVMIEVAYKVAKDPINAKNIEELQHGLFDINNNKENKIFNKDINDNNERFNSYEIKAIMNAIIKISALLAMSVGDAGGEVIHKNLSSKHELHLHSRGKKKLAIFGFCNIRNFEEINLALEEETVPLINKIAEIVHSSVDKFRGYTNKNIGDSFLNVWKFYNKMGGNNNDKRLIKDNLLEIDPTNPQVNITADCAVLAYLRVILKINKNLNILEYNNNKKLKRIMPNFKINMGFGLHLGYGIEGPVGSEFKIEASYLSPNVNIAARLETASKQFGVNLLISGKLYNLFTEDMKGVCRYVDCVTVKGSAEPIDLYTIDINDKITPQRIEHIKIIKTAEEKAKIFKEKKTMLEGLIEEYGSITPIILEKKSYWELIDEKTERFYDSWENAMSSYKEGKWDKAKLYFEECLEEDSKDGPSNTLYNYIKKYNFKSPENWKGERELTSK